MRALLADATADDRVLDPFSGTGTTAVLAASLGVPADAVDLNPFLVWLGNLKLSPDDATTPASVAGAAAAALAEAGTPGAPCWLPDLHAIEKWWDAATLRALGTLAHAVDASGPRGLAGELLRVAFCRVAIQTANVSFGHQSMSFRKTTGPPDPAPDHAAARTRLAGLFRDAACDVAGGLAADCPRAPAHVYLGDARDLAAALPDRHYTRVITSPPYPNRMSYIRELRPYMYWLGYLRDGRQAGALDWQAIGGTWGAATSLLGTWTPPDGPPLPSTRLHDAVTAITADHALLGRYVHKYFVDVDHHLQSLRAVLATGARCHYVVGNSKFYETLLPVEDIYADLLRAHGFLDVEVAMLRKRTSKKELFEYVVSATAPDAVTRCRTPAPPHRAPAARPRPRS